MRIEEEIISKYSRYATREEITALLQVASPNTHQLLLNNEVYFDRVLREFRSVPPKPDPTKVSNLYAPKTSIGGSPSIISNSVLGQSRLPPPKKYVGLYNIGNTCYFNSLLQSLFMVPRFRDSILKLEIPEPTIDTLPRTIHSWDLLRALKILFQQMYISNLPCVNPSDVINNVYNEFGDKVIIGQQQDMVEYMMIFLEEIGHGVRHILHPKPPAADENKKSITTSNPPAQPSQIANSHPGKLAQEKIDQNPADSTTLSNPQPPNIQASTPPNFSTFVDDLFKGQLAWALEIKSKDAPPQKDNLEDFGPLIVSIKEKNLSEALASKLRYELSGFRPDVD